MKTLDRDGIASCEPASLSFGTLRSQCGRWLIGLFLVAAFRFDSSVIALTGAFLLLLFLGAGTLPTKHEILAYPLILLAPTNVPASIVNVDFFGIGVSAALVLGFIAVRLSRGGLGWYTRVLGPALAVSLIVTMYWLLGDKSETERFIRFLYFFLGFALLLTDAKRFDTVLIERAVLSWARVFAFVFVAFVMIDRTRFVEQLNTITSSVISSIFLLQILQYRVRSYTASRLHSPSVFLDYCAMIALSFVIIRLNQRSVLLFWLLYTTFFLWRMKRAIPVLVVLAIAGVLFSQSLSVERSYKIDQVLRASQYISIDGFRALSGAELGTLSRRAYTYQTTLEMISERPLFGYGFSRFGVGTEYVSQTELLPYPHNLLLDIAYRFGLFGLMLFLVLIVYVFRKTKGFDATVWLLLVVLQFSGTIDQLFPFLGYRLLYLLWLGRAHHRHFLQSDARVASISGVGTAYGRRFRWN